MARETLLDHVPVPDENIFRIRGELDPQEAADAYKRDLHRFFVGPGLPRFGLVLLGLGEDGHTASLFPGSPALQEQERWAVSVEHHTPPPPMVPRVTLTLTAINGAAEIFFLVSGENKAGIVAQVLKGPKEAEQLPAQMVQPINGEIYWLMDEESAGKVGQ
jgi:6-phosphogluconolactonase